MKKILKSLGIILGFIIVSVVLFFFFIWLTEFRPEPKEKVEFETSDHEFEGSSFEIMTLNTGYAGLGDDMDFFMDGGSGVNPESLKKVKENIDGINSMLSAYEPDFYFLQEVDKDSLRSYHVDETIDFKPEYEGRAYAQNFVCNWVPFPLPMIGKVDSGIETLSKHRITFAERISLPNSTSWPASMFNLKRCLLVTRIPIKNSEKELVLVNFHLDAYNDNEIKTEQTKVIMDVLKTEYEKGNYVLAGGDFNQSFPGTENAFPYYDSEEIWHPGKLESSMLPEGFTFVCDPSVPSCRSLDKPFSGIDGHQVYCIDGFILSPNLELDSIKTLENSFKYTDHNPVFMRVLLRP